MSLQREDHEPGEGGVLPAAHEVAPLQFEVGFVSSLHDHQAGVRRCLPGHVLVPGEGRDHRPTVQQQTHMYCLPVVDFHHMETETVDSSPRCHEDAPRGVKMAANVDQDLIKVNSHGAVAHLRGLVVGASDGGEGHSAGAGPDGHAQSAPCWLGCGRGVANHQTLSLQHDRLRVVLTVQLCRPPVDDTQNYKHRMDRSRHFSDLGWGV